MITLIQTDDPLRYNIAVAPIVALDSKKPSEPIVEGYVERTNGMWRGIRNDGAQGIYCESPIDAAKLIIRDYEVRSRARLLKTISNLEEKKSTSDDPIYLRHYERLIASLTHKLSTGDY